jgi:hypothetical protein
LSISLERHHRGGLPCAGAIAFVALAAALCLTMTEANAFDEAKYPNLKGQWRRVEAETPRI